MLNVSVLNVFSRFYALFSLCKRCNGDKGEKPVQIRSEIKVRFFMFDKLCSVYECSCCVVCMFLNLI